MSRFRESWKACGQRLILPCLGAALLALLIPGCKSTPPTHQYIKITVKSEADANNGRLVYMVVRSVNQKQFLTQSYRQVSDKLFSEKPDPALIEQLVVFPGKAKTIDIDTKAKPIAIYFLYTSPGDRWKVYVPFSKKKKHEIKIGKDGIVSVD